jgi:hypothetical protein
LRVIADRAEVPVVKKSNPIIYFYTGFVSIGERGASKGRESERESGREVPGASGRGRRALEETPAGP